MNPKLQCDRCGDYRRSVRTVAVGLQGVYLEEESLCIDCRTVLKIDGLLVEESEASHA